MERVAALVEGQTEVHFFRSSYGNSIVQRPFPNGRDVSLDLIVESIVDAIELLKGDILHVVIMLDREGRPCSASEMRQAILQAVEEKCSGRRIYLGVADRHVENWILADESFISEKFGVENYKYDGDGSYGKGKLEALCGPALRGPSDKAQMLKAISAIKAGQNSPSLECFRASIGFDWVWANK